MLNKLLRVLKRKLQRDGFFKVIKFTPPPRTYEKPSEKKKEFSKKILKELRSLISLRIEFRYTAVEQSGSSSGS